MGSQDGDYHGVGGENGDCFKSGDWPAAIETLSQWQPSLAKVRQHVSKHRDKKAHQIDFARLTQDAISKAISAAEPAVFAGRFRSREAANAFLERFLFGRADNRHSGHGEILNLYDSGDYAILSRQFVEGSLDEAISQRDPSRFAEACSAMFAWAVDFSIQHGLRNDGNGAEQAVNRAWVPVVRSFHRSLPKTGTLPKSAATHYFSTRQHHWETNR